MVQANSIASLAKETMNVPPHWIGLILSVITALVILGGIRSIARCCEFLVPFMAVFYVIGCAIILYVHAGFILPALKLILSSAFTATAAGGGFVGATMVMAARFGVARGLFSNESGMGSAPIAAAAAQSRNPVRQALVSSTGTFWDTVVICAMTGLVVVTSVMRAPEALSGLKGAALTNAAFASLPGIGPIVLTVGLLTFVFSTILGWSYYGERCAEYLWGKKAIRPYRILWILAVYAGSVLTLQFVWDFSDMANAMMAIPNLISLLLLSGVIASETRKYLKEGHLEEAS